jgi:hypothetical protein
MVSLLSCFGSKQQQDELIVSQLAIAGLLTLTVVCH